MNPDSPEIKILVVTGSSGGHIFPALSFLDSLKGRQEKIDTLLVLPRSSLKYNIALKEIRYISIVPFGLRLNFKNFIAIFGLIKGSLESLIFLLEFKPDIVVGFGSLYSVPLLLFAWLLRIKTFIHEQNVIPGRANRLLAKFSDKIAISFIETKGYLNVSPQRLVFTGNPIRQELKRVEKSRALSFFGFTGDRFTILVMGGSLGSHRINTHFLKAISMITDKSRFQVIHIAGLQDYDILDNSYKALDLKIKLFAFLKEMQYAYSICDLAISRAGANTVSELMYFKIPAVIIPYPFAYNHQLGNASLLQRTGSAIVIEDNTLDADALRQTLEELMNNPDRLKLMRAHYADTRGADANDLLVNAVLN